MNGDRRALRQAPWQLSPARYQAEGFIHIDCSEAKNPAARDIALTPLTVGMPSPEEEANNAINQVIRYEAVGMGIETIAWRRCPLCPRVKFTRRASPTRV
jgi:hypothetical protein